MYTENLNELWFFHHCFLKQWWNCESFGGVRGSSLSSLWPDAHFLQHGTPIPPPPCSKPTQFPRKPQYPRVTASSEPQPSGSLYHPTQESQQQLNSTLPSRATPLRTVSDCLPEGLTCWPRPPMPPPILRLISDWLALLLAVWQVSYQLQPPSPVIEPSAST